MQLHTKLAFDAYAAAMHGPLCSIVDAELEQLKFSANNSVHRRRLSMVSLVTIVAVRCQCGKCTQRIKFMGLLMHGFVVHTEIFIVWILYIA